MIHLSVPVEPSELMVRGINLGTVKYELSLSNAILSIGFIVLADGRIVCRNESLNEMRPTKTSYNKEDSTFVLDSPDAILQHIGSMRVYPAGRPVDWLEASLQKNLPQLLKEKLEAKAERIS